MIHLRSIELRYTPEAKSFPFTLPVVNLWEPLVFTSPVTYFVGENGSGKSTLMEAIACAIGAITIGSESVKTDPTLKEIRNLGKLLKISWNKRTHRGFFLRAEDFFGYVKQLSKTRAELEDDLNKVDEEYRERSEFARGLARISYTRELSDIQNRYGDGLNLHSHGESYLELFQSRFIPDGLYLLDEPEAALSPLRQLGFLSLLKDMVKRDSQFIIATHSPILMAFPDGVILSFDQVP
jgi:predicted ATPase